MNYKIAIATMAAIVATNASAATYRSYSSSYSTGMTTGLVVGMAINSSHRQAAASAQVPLACLVAKDLEQYKKCRMPSVRQIQWTTSRETSEYAINYNDFIAWEWEALTK